MNNEDVSSSLPPAREGKVTLVLVGCTGLLGDILEQTVVASPSIDVVASVESVTSVAELDGARIATADMVLWNNADDDVLVQWLGSRAVACSPRVLGTTGDGRQATLWELAPRRTRLGSLSPDDVVRTLTSALSGTGGEPSA